MLAQAADKKFSEVVRQLVETALEAEKRTRRKQLVEALKQLDGMVTEDIPDASTTINDVLYGDNGAWKGANAK
jgi:hypothetical protein